MIKESKTGKSTVKTSKKPKIRLKKQVRRTLGGIALASAIVVAAIPARSVTTGGIAQADTSTLTQPTTKLSILPDTNGDGGTVTSSVPYAVATASPNNYANENIPVYTDDEGRFQFVYVDSNGQYDSGAKRYAMIVGYENVGNLPGGVLTIPDTLAAYRLYNSAAGSYCAVAESGNFLYYQVVTEVQEEPMNEDAWAAYQTNHAGLPNTVINPAAGYDYKSDNNIVITGEEYVVNGQIQKDENDKTMYLVTTRTYNYYPCYRDNTAAWSSIPDGDLFWYNDDDSTVSSKRNLVDQDTKYSRIKAAQVSWIGKQYLRSDINKGWVLAGAIDESNGTTRGVFVGDKSQNIQTLVTGTNLSGIGAYAFYGVSGLRGFTAGNGIGTIEDSAFENCISLNSVSIPTQSLSTIGKEAFRNCGSLTDFTMPRSVTTICDGAFLGAGLQTIDMLGGEPDNALTALQNLGYYVFAGCDALTDITIPQQITDDNIDISLFQGCTSLGHVKVSNASTCFKDSEAASGSEVAFTMQEFLENVPETFYFEGPAPKPYPEVSNSSVGKLHKYCRDHIFQNTDTEEFESFAYKFSEDEVYEKAIKGGATEGVVLFQVDNQNTLLQAKFIEDTARVKTLIFPANIGPYHIESISNGAFRDRCNLTSVVLPANINSIGADAFRGCHNLAMVTFNNPHVTIGTDAFKTQDTSLHKNCPDGLTESARPPVVSTTDTEPAVKLHFITDVSSDSTPYNYAKQYSYNHKDQKVVYPIIYTGWPTCLEISYNPDKKCMELVNFPTRSTINDYTQVANTPYMTAAERNAALEAYKMYNGIAPYAAPVTDLNQYTESQRQFLSAMDNLTIPSGVEAIKDGLFNTKVAVEADKMGVISEGLTSIDVAYDASGNVDPTKSDFAGCPFLTSVRLAGTTSLEIPADAFKGCTNTSGTAGLTSVYSTQPISTIGEEAFADNPLLTSVELYGTTAIEKHAFENDTALQDVLIDANLNSLGIAPFYGCESLTDVNFAGNTNFTCSDSIIFETENGANKAVVEVLKGKEGRIQPPDLAGVESLYEEAFANTNLNKVDLSDSQVQTIPTKAFADTPSLTDVVLPESCWGFGTLSFDNSAISYLEGSANFNDYQDGQIMDHLKATGWNGTSGDHTDNSKVTIVAPEGSKLYEKAIYYGYTVRSTPKVPKVYTVNFYGYDDTTGQVTKLVNTQQIEEGGSPKSKEPLYDVVKSYTDKGKTYLMNGWQTTDRTLYSDSDVDAYVVNADTDFYAYYEITDAVLHTVTFKDREGATYKSYTIEDGQTLAQNNIEASSIVLEDAEVGGVLMKHTGWMNDGDISVDSPITRDVTFNPIYSLANGPFKLVLQYIHPDTSETVVYKTIENIEKGTDMSSEIATTAAPVLSGYTFNGWAKAGISPGNANLSSVACDIYLTGTFNSGNGGSGNSGGETPNPDIPLEDDEDVKNGNAFIAYYYYPDGLTLYSKMKVGKGQKAFDIVKPSNYSTGYKWSPNPTETVMDKNTTFVLVTADVNDEKDKFKATYMHVDGVTVYAEMELDKGTKAPDIMKPTGYTTGYEWSPKPTETTMDEDHTFILIPSEGTDPSNKYKAMYYYTDGVTLYQTLEIETGSNAPDLLMPAGYTQCVWSPSPASTPITKDTRFTMVAGPDYNPGGTGTGTGTETGNYYTLTVVNGSGSGTYQEGTQAIIVADEPKEGLQFGSWTISPDNAKIASKGLAATVITMPSENVTVTANYVAKTNGGGTNNGNNNGNNGNNSNNGTTPNGTKTSSGTTVVIDKNGLSNTGVVSATVNGSSDNFTIKITESAQASEAVLKALIAEYGSVDNIAYFPFDISLYDASGEKKITDTSGLTVTITLPLPDSFIQYGGNNKVAGIVNNQLDVMAPKFTTISGVDCITFTCTHFSPYVIYVNTKNIAQMGDTSNGPSDNTPKTGDGIKPKWFLSIGLAALGIFLFAWNGSRRKKAVVKA